jgi:hypothetical protein
MGLDEYENLMESELNTSQLYDACHVLFGSEVDVSADFLRYLQLSGLKAIYRKKALETHPDRAVALTRQPIYLQEQFKEVNAAYRQLHEYLQNPLRSNLTHDRFQQDPARAAQKMNAGSRSPQKPADQPQEETFRRQFFKKVMPKRTLLFGQFIYFDGYISYRQLIDAIVWQKIQRPSVGIIALRWEWLYEDDIRRILKERRWGEKFGESALRGGYLTSEELRIILRRQRVLQPRIGKYFIENGILSIPFVERMAERLRHHNRQYRSR